jgi:hypothetical protein
VTSSTFAGAYPVGQRGIELFLPTGPVLKMPTKPRAGDICWTGAAKIVALNAEVCFNSIA